MQEHIEAMIQGSFLGDSLSLGVHWIYDIEKIRKEHGRVDRPLAPGPDSFHPYRREGEFTHYGDQTMILLESVAEKGEFDLQDFARRWKRLFGDYDGYVDHATRSTLENFRAGKGPEASGSSSQDLAGASRIAPLALVCGRDADAFVDAAVSQARMTHDNPAVLDSAAFFARTAVAVLDGVAPVRAMQEAARAGYSTELESWVMDGVSHATVDTVMAISQFGQSCHVEGAFRGTVQCIARFETDLAGALQANAMAGGDSAARGLLVGMVLGAHLGREALPESWLKALRARGRIGKLIARVVAAEAGQ